MRQKEKRRRSKLKLRPYGVITLQTGEPDNDPVNQIVAPCQPVNRALHKHAAHKKPNIFFSLLKGSMIIGLIALVLSWTVTDSFNIGSPGNTTPSSLTNASVDTDSQSEPVDANGTQDVSNKMAETVAATATTEITDEKAETTDLQNNSTETTAQTESGTDTELMGAEALEPETQTVEPLTIEVLAPETLNTEALNTKTPAGQDINPSAINNQPDTSEVLTPEISTNNSNFTFVKAYKASVFSSLSTNATETPITHGTSVTVLERVGDWVKIEVSSNGIRNTTGFIHITHLSIQ